MYACFTKNYRPTIANNLKTPFELWHGRKPEICNLRIFGETVYLKDDSKDRKKPDPKAIKGMFIGYSPDQKAYRVLITPGTDKVINAPAQKTRFLTQFTKPFNLNNSMFLENDIETSNSKQSNVQSEIDSDNVINNNTSNNPLLQSNQILPNSTTPNPDIMLSLETESIHTDDDIYYDADSDDEIKVAPGLLPVQTDMGPIPGNFPPTPTRHTYTDRSQISSENTLPSRTRSGKPRALLSKDTSSHNPRNDRDPRLELAYFTYHHQVTQGIPKTYWEAHRGEDRDKWLAAEDREIALLDKYSVYKLTTLPTGFQAIKTRMVYEIKKGIPCARFCAKGYEQKPGIDFDTTWAPVVSAQSMRVFFGLAATLDLEIEQMDVSRAFLNSPIDKEIYVMPPPDRGYENKVFLLKKALPGLKQSGMLWHKQIESTLNNYNLFSIKSDPCVYTNGLTADNPMFIAILLVVDDLLVISKNKKVICSTKEFLMKSYIMKDLGPVESYCGFEINRDRHHKTIQLHQSKYIDGILEWMKNEKGELKLETTPMDPKLKFTNNKRIYSQQDTKEQSVSSTTW